MAKASALGRTGEYHDFLIVLQPTVTTPAARPFTFEL
jgi:hypothetical protein